ncbi:5-formyltetrahydrofolate cyclo-ligase isoform X2 [Diabrotica virgifera virgifera]|uniref:5-formyltetrahydrofolate cyclo-ligase n=1 Tax=Diabrotica virgifera virgifera TaxID=50390 RepID=A0A6P7FZE8_DIAVI|nr:5-formyltetrahydrofolate cyclo-ligase isoform X2 [Diabrotica virgifera virgifera]
MITVRSLATKMGSDIKALKTALRKEIEGKLGQLTPQERQRQSQIVKEKLFGLDQFKDARNISIYLSLDTEIDTEPIVRKIFQDQKRCFVPRYNKKVMEMVELHSMEDWTNLPVTKWNIKQPSFKDERKNALDEGLDLIILPGVAFTKNGDRLGHGGGYYDRFLRTVCKKQAKPPALIAVGFNVQVVDSIPTEETDYKLDMVLYSE